MFKRACLVLVLVMCCMLTSCDNFIKRDYGYVFHFVVVGGNGRVVVRYWHSTLYEWKEIESPIEMLGGEKGQRIELTAIPDEGYQVKQWTCNGDIVENNKTNTMLVRAVNPEQVFAITVEFEPIDFGKFYTLTEAYENGWLSHDDLTTIANYHNNEVECTDNLDEAIAYNIKATAAYEMRNNYEVIIPEAKTEDFKILHYYGSYNGCYAVIMDEPYLDSPAVVLDEWDEVSGVKFHYTNPHRIFVWKEKD